VVDARAQEDLIVSLAELYLDTDVRGFLPRLAQQIVASGMPAHELETLWRGQVTPCLHWNLKTVAGEWASFDRRWLLHEVARRADKPGLERLPWLGKLVHRFRSYGVEQEFRFALTLAQHLAQTPAQQREARVAMWLALCRVYYALDSSSAEQASAQLTESQRNEPSLVVEEFRIVCDLLAELLTQGEQKAVAEARVAAWLDRLGLDL
jgi:hypothetical protein